MESYQILFQLRVIKHFPFPWNSTNFGHFQSHFDLLYSRARHVVESNRFWEPRSYPTNEQIGVRYTLNRLYDVHKYLSEFLQSSRTSWIFPYRKFANFDAQCWQIRHSQLACDLYCFPLWKLHGVLCDVRSATFWIWISLKSSFFDFKALYEWFQYFDKNVGHR